MAKRSYTLKTRADSKDATRARIVAATVALHEELGPKNTTISAVAERAGVQRLTVYRHFPDEASLFQACTSQWLEDHPPPVPAEWAGLTNAAERRKAALTALYRYYRRTTRMWTAACRDEQEVAALRQPMRAFRRYLAAVANDLVDAHRFSGARRMRLAATLHHAVQFETWRSLAKDHADADVAALVGMWIAGIEAA